MLDMIKQSLLAGLGAIALSKEALENATRKLVDEKKISTEDARRLVDDLAREGEKANKELQDKISQSLNSMMQSVKLATRSEVDELRARVEELEKKIVSMEAKGPMHVQS
jgi:polyhydroxyalkanoate synthesis regulator phasin